MRCDPEVRWVLLSLVREPDDALRLAIMEAWKNKCAWCRRPLTYNLMEIDHIVPLSYAGAKLDKIVRHYDLPALFDVTTTRNLAPSCRQCNGEKGDRPMPKAPVLLRILEKAATQAPRIEAAAARFRSDRQFEKALAIIRSTSFMPVPDHLERLSELDTFVKAEHQRIAGNPLTATLHSYLLHDPQVPETRRAKRLMGKKRLLGMMNQWLETDEWGIESLRDSFDSDDQSLQAAHVTQVRRLAYSDDSKAFLARMDFDVRYLHHGDGYSAQADTTVILDLWIQTDERIEKITDVYLDLMGVFPD